MSSGSGEQLVGPWPGSGRSRRDDATRTKAAARAVSTVEWMAVTHAVIEKLEIAFEDDAVVIDAGRVMSSADAVRYWRLIHRDGLWIHPESGEHARSFGEALISVAACYVTEIERDDTKPKGDQYEVHVRRDLLPSTKGDD